MKRITAIAFFAIANLALAGHSFAQSGVRATVPFDFTVGNKLLPAGTYYINTASDTRSVIAIRNHDKPIAVMTSVNPDGKRSPNGGRWVFKKYGDQYFLSEILCDDANLNVIVPTSKTEKKVRLQEAWLAAATQTTVAAR
ncbi:MAG: hypothetical protein WA510_05120 [Acidobacteriaceae bacterium]